MDWIYIEKIGGNEMSELVKRQFSMGRQQLLQDIEGTAKELFDVQLPGLPNTLHWQVGHILTVQKAFYLEQKVNFLQNIMSYSDMDQNHLLGKVRFQVLKHL